MQDQLISFIEDLKADRRIDSFDEAATKQAVVLRLLSLLGWDIFNIDEVMPEYSVAGWVDYSLRIDNVNKVFIEVKKIGEELENHQEQLLRYSFEEGVKLSILTNGATWWFYLPLQERSWEQRKFYTIDILQQESEDIVSKFVDFISKDNVSSGKAIENAEALYKGQQKTNILKETLPKAWNKIIEEGDDLLIDLINDTTEKLCGYKADSNLIEKFLSRHKDNLIISAPPPTKLTLRPGLKGTSRTATSVPGSYSGKPTSFWFRETKYEVRSWRDLLIGLCNVIANKHSDEFESILFPEGKERPYFYQNIEEARRKRSSGNPTKIKNTKIYVETNLSSNSILNICFDLVTLFGYLKNDLRIEPH